MDDIVAITLFRHGLTEENKRRAYLGWTDSPLCQVGKREISKVGVYYDQLFSSDLGRCLETAKEMFPTYDPHIMTELREMNFGQWEGKVYEELKHDEEYRRWLVDPSLIKPPNGETFAEFSIRVIHGWEQLTKRILDMDMKRAAIMTHGGVIRFLLMRFSPEKKSFWEWTASHGKGYEFIWNREGLRRGERCILLQEVPLMAKQNG